MAAITFETASLEIDLPVPLSQIVDEGQQDEEDGSGDDSSGEEDGGEEVPVSEEHEVEDCFMRRPEIEHLCLRRSDEDVLALRRAPECPNEFACPAAGCV